MYIDLELSAIGFWIRIPATLSLHCAYQESLFSQYKHSAGGKLDAANYANSRCAHLVKQCVAPHHSGKHYRDESATFMELPLVKKQYNKTSSS